MKTTTSLVKMLSLPTIASADTIRIATWNLGGFSQMPQYKLENITEEFRNFDADQLFPPEINPRSHGETITSALTTSGEWYESDVQDRPRAAQVIGNLHKCDVEISNVGLIDGSDLGRQGHRETVIPHAIHDQFDFVTVGLPLKASGASLHPIIRKCRNSIQLLSQPGLMGELYVL